MRTLPDGSRVHPRGVKHVSPGFEVDPSNPNIEKPILPECKHRYKGVRVLPCGKVEEALLCHEKLPVSFYNCSNCSHREE